MLAPPCCSASEGTRSFIAGNRQLTEHPHCESPRCGGPRSKGTGSFQGPFERFTGILIEHCAGNLPLWLAPRQVVVATITSDADSYAREAHDALVAAGLRAELDCRNEKIGYKVREHSLAQVPVLLVVGRQAADRRQVAVRRLGEPVAHRHCAGANRSELLNGWRQAGIGHVADPVSGDTRGLGAGNARSEKSGRL